MANPVRYWQCKCSICARFLVDADVVQAFVKTSWARYAYTAFPSRPGSLVTMDEDDPDLGYGCDFCAAGIARLPRCPSIIKTFLGIESFCEACRDRLCRFAHEEDWHICWAGSSDDEIKWFLTGFVLYDFLHHWAGREFIMWRACCELGVHARRAHKKPKPWKEMWREKYPNWADEEDKAARALPEIKLRIRRRSTGRFV